MLLLKIDLKLVLFMNILLALGYDTYGVQNEYFLSTCLENIWVLMNRFELFIEAENMYI